MKKLLLAALLGSAGCLMAHSQNPVFDNPDNKAYFGLRLSLDIACPGDISNGNFKVDLYKPGAGFDVGVIYNIPLVANLYFEPGISLFYNTYLTKDVLISDGLDFAELKGSVRKFGFRLPLLAGYRFDFTDQLSVSVFTGPVLEVGLSGKMHASMDGISDSETIYNDEGINRFDALWKFGAGVGYDKFYASISGSVGMCNMNKVRGASFHENLVQIGIGYNF